MIDHCMKWNTEADAIAAAEAAGAAKLGSRDNEGNWHWSRDFVSPDLQAWRISQDTTGPQGEIIHKYLAGWFCIISLQKRNAKLADDPATQFVLNRDGPPYLIENNLGSVIRDIGFQPIFAGSHYPMGFNEWLGKAKLTGAGQLTVTAS